MKEFAMVHPVSFVTIICVIGFVALCMVSIIAEKFSPYYDVPEVEEDYDAWVEVKDGDGDGDVVEQKPIEVSHVDRFDSKV